MVSKWVRVVTRKGSVNGPNPVLGNGCRRGDVYCLRSSSFGCFANDIGGCAGGDVNMGEMLDEALAA